MRRTLRHQSAPAPRGRGRRTVAALAGAALLFGSATTAAMATGAGPEAHEAELTEGLSLEDPTEATERATQEDLTEEGSELTDPTPAPSEEVTDGDDDSDLPGEDADLDADSEGDDATIGEASRPGDGDAEETLGLTEDSEDALLGAELEGELDAETYAQLLAAPGVSECDYATEGTGTYADIFCWLDFSFLLANGTTQPFTTEYVRADGSNAPVTGLGDFNAAAWVPKLGAEYKPTSTPALWTPAEAQPHVVYGSFGHTTCTDGQQCVTTWVQEWRVFGPIVGYPVEITLGETGHLKFHAKLDVRGKAGQIRNGLDYEQWTEAPDTNPMKWRSQALEALQFPVNTNSFFGNTNPTTGKSFYTGVAGKPALYQIAQPATPAGQTHATVNVAQTELNLRDVSVTNSKNEAVLTGYGVVVADVETTDSAGAYSTGGDAERITWTSDKDFMWLPNAQYGTEGSREWYVGNACTGGWSPAFGSTATTAGCLGKNTPVQLRTGTAMLLTNTPKWVKQEMLGGGIEGVAYALMLAKAEVSVEVKDWIVGADNKTLAATATATMDAGALGDKAFTTSVSTPGGSDNAAGELATTGSQEAAVDFNGNAITFSSVNPDPANYTAAWSCDKTGLNVPAGEETYTGATAPTGTDGRGFTNLKPGQKVACHVVYTPQYLTLIKTVEGNDATGGTALATDWTLAAGHEVSTISGASAAASVTTRPVAVGDYDLSETGPDGYRWTGLACEGAEPSTATGEDGELTSASVTVPKLGNVACTYTNTAVMPKLTLVKEIDGVEQELVVPADWTLTATGPTTTGPTTPISGATGTPAVTDVEAKVGSYALNEALDGSKAALAPAFDLTALQCVSNEGANVPFTTVDFERDEYGIVTPGSIALALGNDVTCTFTNTPKPGSVTWNKVAENEAPLSGSEWLLKGPGLGEEGLKLSEESCQGPSDDQGLDPYCTYTSVGVFEVSNLGWGDFTLVETKAPPGYMENDTEYPFTISPADGLEKLDVDLGSIVNRMVTPPTLPMTGGQGAAMFAILGGGLLLGAGGLVALSRRRRPAEQI